MHALAYMVLIKGLILVEIMNVDRFRCQRRTPVFNNRFSLIESTPKTRDRIKMLSAAVGSMGKSIMEFVDPYKGRGKNVLSKPACLRPRLPCCGKQRISRYALLPAP